eukprot:6454926-Amphidinium_carterae.1
MVPKGAAPSCVVVGYAVVGPHWSPGSDSGLAAWHCLSSERFSQPYEVSVSFLFKIRLEVRHFCLAGVFGLEHSQ